MEVVRQQTQCDVNALIVSITTQKHKSSTGYEVSHGQVLAAATYKILKQLKKVTSSGHKKIPILSEYLFEKK